jgi:hypothetical protein
MKNIVSRFLNSGAYIMIISMILGILGSCSSDGNGSSNVPANDIAVKSISPNSPATLDHYETGSNDRVKIDYDYNITYADGARIWIQPFTNGSASPGYLYSKSSIFKGTGSRSVVVSIEEDAGEVHVDQLRIIVSDPDQTTDLTERFVDVDYTFE